jgi:murein DD-endopeptidase MepM/ murein hydrolase activator NlpD
MGERGGAKHRGCRLLIGLLLAVLAAVCLVAPAAAQSSTPVVPAPAGLVLVAAPQGEGGLQSDAALISPRRPSASAQPAPSQSYTVQTGDTLSAIAARQKLDTATLAALNGIADSDQVQAGQILRLPGGPVRPPALPPGGPLARMQFWPWPPKQGQTLVVWLRAAADVSQTVSFGGQAYPVLGGNRQGYVLLPIPALLPPGPQALIVAAGGQTVTLSIPVAAGTFDFGQVPAEITDPILGQTAKVRAEDDRLAAIWAGHSPLPWTPHLHFRSPLDVPAVHTAPFGSRRTYGSSPTIVAHAGEDLSVPAGTAVLAPAGGKVVLAELLFERGNGVVLDHGHGVFTCYWHLSAIDVKVGDMVSSGQKLGEVGSTGLSTGPHLHWEMHVNGVAVDPLQWLDAPK